MLLATGALVGGCRSRTEASRPLPQAKFGLFFGGQVQQRTEIPFELDSTRQTLGLRLDFGSPVTHPTEIRWILNYPTARRGPRGRSNAPRAERSDSSTLAAGADRFEQLLTLRPSDFPGTYNVRVFVDSKLVLDRPFLVTSRQLEADD